MAVANNKSGLFNKEEQTIAKDLINRQFGQALHSLEVTPGVAMQNPSPIVNDKVGFFQRGVDFLKKASPEEKASPQWLESYSLYTSGLEEAKEQNQKPNEENPILTTIEAILNLFKQSENEKDNSEKDNKENLENQQSQQDLKPSNDLS